MNRFFVSEANLKAENVVFDSRQAHRIRNVLRMRPGERIIVLDNQGWEYDVTLTQVNRDQVLGQITEKRSASTEPQVQITLYQSLLAREKFEWVLQKCTEVGVSRFVPVITERSVVRDKKTIGPGKLDRWRRIITEAAEQSRRGRIPQLNPPLALDQQAVSGLDAFDCRLIATTHQQDVSLREILRQDSGQTSTVAVFIGPEGGFTEQELQLCQDSGATIINLGPRILRTETAAMVATALILYELDQLQI